MSLSAVDYGDFTRIMALYKLYYLLTYLLTGESIVSLPGFPLYQCSKIPGLSRIPDLFFQDIKGARKRKFQG